MSGKPEQIVQKLAEQITQGLHETTFTQPTKKGDIAKVINRELQPLADLIRAAQKIASKVPRDQCQELWDELDLALDNLGSI